MPASASRSLTASGAEARDAALEQRHRGLDRERLHREEQLAADAEALAAGRHDAEARRTARAGPRRCGRPAPSRCSQLSSTSTAARSPRAAAISPTPASGVRGSPTGSSWRARCIASERVAGVGGAAPARPTTRLRARRRRSPAPARGPAASCPTPPGPVSVTSRWPLDEIHEPARGRPCGRRTCPTGWRTLPRRRKPLADGRSRRRLGRARPAATSSCASTAASRSTQLGAGLDPHLLDERLAGPLEGAQRVGLLARARRAPASAGPSAAPAAARSATSDSSSAARRRWWPRSSCGIDQVLDGRLAQLVEARPEGGHDLRVRARRRAGRPARARGRARGRPAVASAPCAPTPIRASSDLEAQRVDVLLGDQQLVARRPGGDEVGLARIHQDAPQLRHDDLDGVAPRHRLVAPERVDEAVRGDGAARLRGRGSPPAPCLGPGEGDLDARRADDLDGPEHTDLHAGTLPLWPGSQGPERCQRSRQPIEGAGSQGGAITTRPTRKEPPMARPSPPTPDADLARRGPWRPCAWPSCWSWRRCRASTWR